MLYTVFFGRYNTNGLPCPISSPTGTLAATGSGAIIIAASEEVMHLWKKKKKKQGDDDGRGDDPPTFADVLKYVVRGGSM